MKEGVQIHQHMRANLNGLRCYITSYITDNKVQITAKQADRQNSHWPHCVSTSVPQPVSQHRPADISQHLLSQSPSKYQDTASCCRTSLQYTNKICGLVYRTMARYGVAQNLKWSPTSYRRGDENISSDWEYYITVALITTPHMFNYTAN